MNQQEEGWPLGLQPLSMRLGLQRNYDFFGSFSTLNTDSSSSNSITSSDFDSESMESESPSNERKGENRACKGGRRSIMENLREKKGKNRAWFFSRCTKAVFEFEKGDEDATMSLGQFLEKERKACKLHGFCRASNRGTPLIFQCIGFGGEG